METSDYSDILTDILSLADEVLNPRKARRERIMAGLCGGEWATQEGPGSIADFAEELLDASDALDPQSKDPQ